MVKRGLPPDIVLCSTLLDGLCLARRMDDALEVFDKMPEWEASSHHDGNPERCRCGGSPRLSEHAPEITPLDSRDSCAGCGAAINQYCKQLVALVSPMMPLIAVACIAILCGSAIARNAPAILSYGLQVVVASCFLHASGFFFGFLLSRMPGVDEPSSRTISIEVGMQNSVHGVVLASQHFSNPLTAVPCAVSSVCHSIYGSILAGI